MKILFTKYLSLLFLFLLLSSCGMWSNFTAYYNRFYIAESAFEEGEEDIALNQEKPLFQFKEEKLPAKANKNFDTVIKFSSKILQFNQDSKYVIEAIYMIAKAYYYKAQYNKGLRKFIELDKLNNKDYGLSAKLWIAKCELQMRNFQAGLEHLNQVKTLALKNEDENILFQVYVSEISYLIYREEYSKAVTKIEELANQNLEDEVKSEVTYELGMLYISLENYEKAVVAFERVDEGEPNFEIEFKSKLEYAKAIKHLDREAEALDRLNYLRDNTKYEKYWDIIDLEIAQIELESGNVEIALDIFYSIDTGYTKDESSGIAAFMQGDIMEHIYMDYDSAKILYEKVATKKAPKEYKIEAREKSNLLKQRSKLTEEIFTSIKGYNYLIDTLLYKSDSLAYAGYESRKDSAMQVANELKEENGIPKTETKTRLRGASRGTSKALKAQFKYEEDSLFTYKPIMPLISLDSMRNKIASSKYELGNLYFSDLIVPDSAYFYYQDVVNNYSDTKYQAKGLYALGSYYLTVDKKQKADSLFQFVYDNFKSDPVARVAAIRLGITMEEQSSDPALEKYYVAENLIEQEKYYDAIEELNSIYKDFPKSQYSSKALYSIGWIYENKLSDYEGAVQYYDTLKAKYPKTEYVREVSSRLSFYHQKLKAFQDSVARVHKAIADSIKADSLAQFKRDSLANAPMIDSVAISDSTSIIDSTSIVDSTASIDSTTSSIVDTTKNISDSTLTKFKMDENILDSTKNKIQLKRGKLPIGDR